VIATVGFPVSPEQSSDEGPIRVLIADGQALMRHGIRAILDLSGGFEVVAEAGHVNEVTQHLAGVQVDVALVEMELPGGGVFEVLKHRTRLKAAVKVLVAGTRTAEPQLLPLLAASACGMILKEGAAATVIGGIREVHRTSFFVAPDISRKVIDRWHRTPARPGSWAQPGVAQLSNREREMLTCIGAGMANREIASHLSISVKTVEAHKSHIATKLGLRGAVDLVRFATREQWGVGQSPLAQSSSIL